MHIHLVDGTYELFRNHYGAPGARAPDGTEVGATRGLMRSLWSLLQAPEVTHVACAFDTVVESFRNDLFPGYKTGEGIEPELLAQFPLAEAATRAMGLVTWSMREFEADDALATAVARWRSVAGLEQIVLCTPDKDLAQCVEGDRVVLCDRRRGVILDEAGVLAKWGVAPASIPDFLALVGDSADGIPGIPGWGAKSAAKVLGHYGTLDRIPDQADLWAVEVRGAKRLAAELAAARSEARLFKQLATLRTDVPLREDLEDLRFGGVRRAELEELCGRLGWPQFLRAVS